VRSQSIDFALTGQIYLALHEKETRFRWHEVKPETVGQFTGITDRNGVEIWEGDIVRYHFQNSWHRAEMIFTDGAFRIRGWSHGQLTHTFEVAGNIHEQ
jgi:uncharacterized phage protein (TIGR01671 family)